MTRARYRGKSWISSVAPSHEQQSDPGDENDFRPPVPAIAVCRLCGRSLASNPLNGSRYCRHTQCAEYCNPQETVS